MAEKKSKLADNKIKPTEDSALAFLETITPDQKRQDGLMLYEMMKKATGEEPVLWSNAFIGFGMRRHVSPTTGRESDWMRIGFAPRKTNLTLYFGAYVDTLTDDLAQLGKYKAGMGCIYVNKLADIDLKVLARMIKDGWAAK
jgi:hypothetical protein